MAAFLGGGAGYLKGAFLGGPPCTAAFSDNGFAKAAAFEESTLLGFGLPFGAPLGFMESRL